jgi:hypothetical protein
MTAGCRMWCIVIFVFILLAVVIFLIACFRCGMV